MENYVYKLNNELLKEAKNDKLLSCDLDNDFTLISNSYYCFKIKKDDLFIKAKECKALNNIYPKKLYKEMNPLIKTNTIIKNDKENLIVFNNKANNIYYFNEKIIKLFEVYFGSLDNYKIEYSEYYMNVYDNNNKMIALICKVNYEQQ